MPSAPAAVPCVAPNAPTAGSWRLRRPRPPPPKRSIRCSARRLKRQGCRAISKPKLQAKKFPPAPTCLTAVQHPKSVTMLAGPLAAAFTALVAGVASSFLPFRARKNRGAGCVRISAQRRHGAHRRRDDAPARRKSTPLTYTSQRQYLQPGSGHGRPKCRTILRITLVDDEGAAPCNTGISREKGKMARYGWQRAKPSPSPPATLEVKAPTRRQAFRR